MAKFEGGVTDAKGYSNEDHNENALALEQKELRVTHSAVPW